MDLSKMGHMQSMLMCLDIDRSDRELINTCHFADTLLRSQMRLV